MKQLLSSENKQMGNKNNAGLFVRNKTFSPPRLNEFYINKLNNLARAMNDLQT